jgi:uncharacterized Ntn-hydrolase superfamily protein
VGVAVQSKYFAVGAVVPWARAGVGAVATQAAGVAAYGPAVLAQLEQGVGPEEALRRALAGDDGRETRQLGVVSADGVVAVHTGSRCNEWAGDVVGDGFAALGNILAGPAVVEEMARAFRETPGLLSERLLAGLEAAQAAGGDRRGQQSAALIVERRGAADETREGIDRVVDLRVDDHPQPVAELRRLIGIQQVWGAIRLGSARRAQRDFEGAIHVLADALRRFPDDATLLYELACHESLAGRPDEALGHLRRSLELDPGYREAAAADDDFADLRGDARFRAVTGPA